MGTPTANVSRDTFDASKGYSEVRLQQGVPIFDADWNEAQANIFWKMRRSNMMALGAIANLPDQEQLAYPLLLLVNQEEQYDTAWPPSPFTALTTWNPGAMRPYVFDAGDTNDFGIMWGPSWVYGDYVDDYESRGVASKYTDATNRITDGKITAAPVGTTIEDDSQNFALTDGSLHLTGPSGGVGNGVASPCRVRFITGAEAGNTYPISAVPASDRLTLTGPFLSGGPSIGDSYAILPNSVVFTNGNTEGVWLGIYYEDIDENQDGDITDPTTLIEGTHRTRVRYFHRVLRSGANLPTSAVAPSPATAAPQRRESRIFWFLVATITPGAGAPTIFPGDIAFGGAPQGIYRMASLAALNDYVRDLKDGWVPRSTNLTWTWNDASDHEVRALNSGAGRASFSGDYYEAAGSNASGYSFDNVGNGDIYMGTGDLLANRISPSTLTEVTVQVNQATNVGLILSNGGAGNSRVTADQFWSGMAVGTVFSAGGNNITMDAAGTILLDGGGGAPDQIYLHPNFAGGASLIVGGTTKTTATAWMTSSTVHGTNFVHNDPGAGAGAFEAWHTVANRFSLHSAYDPNGTITSLTRSTGVVFMNGNSDNWTARIPVNLPTGQRYASMSLWHNNDAVCTCEARFKYITRTTGSTSTLETITAGTVASITESTGSTGAGHIIDNDANDYFVEVEMDNQGEPSNRSRFSSCQIMTQSNKLWDDGLDF